MNQLSLLVLRLYFGGMMLAAHGWPKLMSFSEKSAVFPDPLGVGSQLSLSLAIFSEVVCAGLVVVGLFSRFASINLIITMFVAAFIVHANDPFPKQEFPMTYMMGYVAIFLAGSGDYSLQKMMGITSNSRWKIVSFMMK